jgi:thiol-disulfide isomerase/thioredoxin
MRTYALLIAMLFAPSLAFSQEKSPADQYAAIVKAYEKAADAYAKQMQSGKTVAEQGKLFREQDPQPKAALQMLTLAKDHPGDPTAYRALTWIVQTSEFGPAAEKPYAEAIQLLATKYVDHKDNEKLFDRMAISPFASSESFLRAVFEKHPSGVVRGRAGHHLGLFLKNYVATVENLRSRPDWAKNVAAYVGPELVKQLKDADTTKMLARAEEAFERVQKNHAFVSYKKTNLGKAAEAELFELRHLAVGKVAPEIDAEDTEGNKLKLSDYRGKVVVLVFWGTWCPHCMAMVPQERALVKKYEGKPFAMVGINSDVERDKLKAAYTKHGITWRSFYDGPSVDGPIASRWNVQGWPTVYVLDAKGSIRFKYVRDEYLDRAVAELMNDGTR